MIKLFRHFQTHELLQSNCKLPSVSLITFTLQIFCFCTLFSYNNFWNKGKRYSCQGWRYKLKLLEVYLIFTSFPTKKKAHVIEGWTLAMNIKTFRYSSPYSSLAMKVGRRTFDSSHHIHLRRRSWATKLITAVGTKLKRIFYFWFCLIFIIKFIFLLNKKHGLSDFQVS